MRPRAAVVLMPRRRLQLISDSPRFIHIHRSDITALLDEVEEDHGARVAFIFMAHSQPF